MRTFATRAAAILCFFLILASASIAQDPFALRGARQKTEERSVETKLEPKQKKKPTSNATAKREESATTEDALVLTSSERVPCAVLGFSGCFGVRARVDGAEKVFSTSEIERVELEVSDEFATGASAYENGVRSGAESEFRRALALFQSARKSAPRRLEKEWATAKIAETLAALGRSEEAVDEFLLLCRVDAEPAYLGSAPLRWTDKRGVKSSASDLDERIKAWLARTENPSGVENPTGRLLAASYLLTSARYKQDAIDALRDLVLCEAPSDAESELVQTRKTISLLATAQLWRAELVKKPTEREVERWARTVELLPAPLRVGPTYLVASGYKALGRDEEAARLFARVAVLATNDRVLAQRAASDAADAFERLEDKDSADALREDMRTRFGE